MWVLPSRGRQERCQATLDAISRTGLECRGIVWVDGDKYELNLPEGWGHYQTDDHRELGGVLRSVFQMHPDQEFYGFISDDTVPKTRGWNTALELSAVPNGMSSSNDMWKKNSRMAGALCFGGELLRSLGYWVPEGMCHLYIDDVWEKIGRDLDCWTYRSDVIVEHEHFANSKRQRDDTDNRTLNGKPYAGNDQSLYQAWLKDWNENLSVLRATAA